MIGRPRWGPEIHGVPPALPACLGGRQRSQPRTLRQQCYRALWIILSPPSAEYRWNCSRPQLNVSKSSNLRRCLRATLRRRSSRRDAPMNGSNPRPPPSESVAIAIAIGSVALGVIVVWLAKSAVDSLEGSVLIALVLLPFLVYLISSGKLAEFKAPGGIEAKFVEAAKESVTAVSGTISYDDPQVVAKVNVGDLLKRKAGEIDQSRPVVMTMTIASSGQYTVADLKQYLDVLSQFRNFKTVVFLDSEQRFIACMQAWALKQLVTLPDVADEFITPVNPRDRAGVLRFPGILKKTISPTSTNVEALREMQDHNLEALIVVDQQGTLRGVVERYQVLSRLMLSLVR